MVDNRSAGFFGIGGAFNFKSGDISGTAANTQDDKMGPGTEYGFMEASQEQNENTSPFVDRSAQLRATLNSLAMMNVANVLNTKKRLNSLSKTAKSKLGKEEEKDEEFLDDYEDNFQENDNE